MISGSATRYICARILLLLQKKFIYGVKDEFEEICILRLQCCRDSEHLVFSISRIIFLRQDRQKRTRKSAEKTCQPFLRNVLRKQHDTGI